MKNTNRFGQIKRTILAVCIALVVVCWIVYYIAQSFHSRADTADGPPGNKLENPGRVEEYDGSRTKSQRSDETASPGMGKKSKPEIPGNFVRADYSAAMERANAFKARIHKWEKDHAALLRNDTENGLTEVWYAIQKPLEVEFLAWASDALRSSEDAPDNEKRYFIDDVSAFLDDRKRIYKDADRFPVKVVRFQVFEDVTRVPKMYEWDSVSTEPDDIRTIRPPNYTSGNYDEKYPSLIQLVNEK